MAIIKKRTRLMYRREVLDQVGVTYPTLWRWMQAGYFPRSRTIGDQKVAWIESEVEKFLNELPVAPLKGDDAEAAS